MSTEQDLPEGITFNNNNVNQIDIDLNEEKISVKECDACELILEAVLAKLGSRNFGIIKAIPKDNILWENSLPKDREKAIKMLNETLTSKIEKHKERH
jgi:hypothetical protein